MNVTDSALSLANVLYMLCCAGSSAVYQTWACLRVFVCLFAVNAKTTARIDPKHSGITKNDPESVLCVLKSPVLVFLGRYRDIPGFSFAANRHFYVSPFHFWLLPRRQIVKTPKLRNGLTPNAQELRRTTRRVSYGG